MPEATMREQSPYYLPEDEVFHGILRSVLEQRFPYLIKSGPSIGQPATYVKWRWEFEILEGEFAGKKAYGNSEPEVTDLEEPKGKDSLVRPWAEALLGRKLAIGEPLNTDTMLLGLHCRFTVKHEPPTVKKDGGSFYPCPVDVVLSATASADPEFVPF